MKYAIYLLLLLNSILVFMLSFLAITLKVIDKNDLVALTDRYEVKIASVSAELKREIEYSKQLQENDMQNYLEDIEFMKARCVCKYYSGETDNSGRFIESYPENRQLTKQQICK